MSGRDRVKHPLQIGIDDSPTTTSVRGVMIFSTVVSLSSSTLLDHLLLFFIDDPFHFPLLDNTSKTPLLFPPALPSADRFGNAGKSPYERIIEIYNQQDRHRQ